MPIETYNDLLSTIADYLNRPDLASQIESFVSLAEKRINRNLRVWAMEYRSVVDVVGGQSAIAVPERFLEARMLKVNVSPSRGIELVTPIRLEEIRSATPGGIPTSYSMQARQIEFAPVPNQDMQIEMLFYRGVTPLTAGNQTNELFPDFADVYLYAALTEAEPYLMNDERIQVWGTLYDRAIEAIKEEDERTAWNAATLNQRLSVNIV